MVTMFCIRSSDLFHLRAKILYFYQPLLIFSTPQPLATTFLLSVYMSLIYIIFILHSKRHHEVSVFPWLISLSLMPSSFIHVVSDSRRFSFTWLNNIALYIYIYFTSLSIHSLIHRYMGCFHILTMYIMLQCT